MASEGFSQSQFVMKNLVRIGFLLIILFIGSNRVWSQEPDTIASDFQGLVGEVSRSQLQNSEFKNSFYDEYRSYEPSDEAIQKLSDLIYNYRITVVMGTWCSDSKMQVPRFFKILDQLDYNTSKIRIICVDKDKLAGNLDISSLSIKYVPIFIFKMGNEEKGRIVESPETTLEGDMIRILSD